MENIFKRTEKKIREMKIMKENSGRLQWLKSLAVCVCLCIAVLATWSATPYTGIHR